MAAYDLYGCKSEDMRCMRNSLEAALGIRFDHRESDYQGGDYFQWKKNDGEHFILKRNLDPIDGKPAEMSFPAHKILFYINDTMRSAELQEKIAQGAKNFALLRHEDLA